MSTNDKIKIRSVVNSFNNTKDIVMQNNRVINLLNIAIGENIIEVGCGLGLFSKMVSDKVGSSGTVIGIDINKINISIANENNRISWLNFFQGDAMKLPVDDSIIDVLIGVQIAEYLPDIDSFLFEGSRVLNDKGRAMIVTTDWESLKWSQWNTDFYSKWIKHCYNPKLHSQLRDKLIDVGFKYVDVEKFSITNHIYSPAFYSYWLSLVIYEYLSTKKLNTIEECAEWIDKLENDNKQGHYYFSVNRYIFYARR